MPFALPPLPYAQDALAPYMSSETLRFHHDGHQARYVRTTNEMLKELGGSEDLTLAEVVELAGRYRETAPLARQPYWRKLYDNASQAWNHTLFWHSMDPNGGGRPTGPLAPFYDRARDYFREEAKALFGSGWVWLVFKDGQVRVVSTPNGERPQGRALLVLDVWEHAYYLDYPDAKGEFIDVWLDNLVNWDFAERMMRGEIPDALR